MKKVCIFTLFVTLCPPLWALPLNVIPGDLGSFEIQLSLELDSVTREFQLDTGANNTILKPDAQSLAYPSMGKSKARGASGVEVDCDLVQPQQFRWDQHVIKAPLVERCDFGIHSLNNLGMNILNNLILDLDPRQASLEMLAQFPSQLSPHPLERLSQGHSRLRVQIAADSVTKPGTWGAIFDTGAQLSAIDSVFADAHPEWIEFLQDVEGGLDVTGNPVKMKLYRIKFLRVGNQIFHDVTWLGFDFHALRTYLGPDTPLILGNNVILQARWILDFKSNQWAVLP